MIIKNGFFKHLKSKVTCLPKSGLTMTEIEVIKTNLKISRSRVLKHYENMMIERIKPGHPEKVRALKEQIRNKVSRIR